MKKTVLIADDVVDIRLMLRYILEKGDYVVVAEAANGVEAVEKYHEHLPDITIMDIEMPYLNGVDAAREIRAADSDARIIFCSGSLPNEPELAIDLGDGEHSIIPKPFLPAQLYEAMSL